MSAMPSLSMPKSSTNSPVQVSISNDHTLKSRVMRKYYARFGIGGGEGDLVADHTGSGLSAQLASRACEQEAQKNVEVLIRLVFLLPCHIPFTFYHYLPPPYT